MPPTSDPTGPVVIVDPYSSGGQYAPALTAAGIPVVAVTSRPVVPPVYAASFRPEDFPEVIPYDGDLSPVLARLSQLAPRCVLPGTETGVELADLLAARLTPSRANDPASSAARRNKWEMSVAAAAAGLPTLAQICTDDVGEVADWIDRNGLAGRDLVVKPPRSASTDGVSRVAGGIGWRSVFDAQLGQRNQWDILNDRMLVQEYAVGTEYVVDTFTADGVHTVTDVCRYRKTDNGQHMAVYDTMDWLPPDAPEVGPLTDYTRRFLDAVGFRFGAAHVELMLTAEGLRLIEINARPHGGGQPRFCRAATGDSQVHRTAQYLAGQRPVPAGYELLRHTRVVFLIARSAGIVHGAEALDELSGLASFYDGAVHIRDGDRISPTRDLLGTLALGFVVLVHADPDQIRVDSAAVRDLESRVRILPEDDRIDEPA
jgi:biotin carboxylase